MGTVQQSIEGGRVAGRMEGGGDSANSKKGEGVKDYRGVTLMPTLYKIYTAVLAERLREEIEEKGLIPPNQTGFRRGMGTMDNIFVLNYLINRQIEKKGGKMVAVFIDLRAAFDSVDRKILLRMMRRRGVREGIIERVWEILRETKGRVRVGEEGILDGERSEARLPAEPPAVQYDDGGFGGGDGESKMGGSEARRRKDLFTGNRLRG